MSTALSLFTILVFISDSPGSFSKAEPIAGWVEPSADSEFPFIVSIARKFDILANNPYGHICGGALITRKYVLTAASCFLNGNSPNIIIRDYFVYVGSSDLAKSSKFEIQSWMSYESWISPFRSNMSYKTAIDGPFNKDIALLRLATQITSPIIPAKISNISPTELEDHGVVTAGWGTFDDVIPKNMLKADLKVLRRDQCLQNVQIASNDVNYNHEDNIFCTNANTLFAVLDYGDKGSPVLTKHTDGSYRIVGINLKTVPSANNVTQVADQQNLHLSVHRFMDYIRIVARPRYLYPVNNVTNQSLESTSK